MNAAINAERNRIGRIHWKLAKGWVFQTGDCETGRIFYLEGEADFRSLDGDGDVRIADSAGEDAVVSTDIFMTIQSERFRVAAQTLCIHTVYMAPTIAEPKKALGVRATAEQHRIIAEAAKREHRSVSNFVLQAALQAAHPRVLPPPRFTDEEARDAVRKAQETFRKSKDFGRDLVAELFAQRQADALRD